MTLTIARKDIDSLKNQIDLVDLIGRSVSLNRAGTWMTGCCPFHKESDPSFAVKDNRYQCFSCDARGDVFDWLAFDQGLDPEKDWLKIFKLAQDLANDHSVDLKPTRYDPLEKAKQNSEDAEARRQKAYATLLRGLPITGTKAEQYLRDCRGIRTVDFSGMPLRFIDNYPYWTWCKQQKKAVKVGEWPAMLAAIQQVIPDENGNHRFLALHITWFDLSEPQGKAKIIYRQPDGTERKLPRKKVKGDYFGKGAIMLTPAGEDLATTEGIENGLTALELGPRKHCWVAVAMNAMGTMPLLPITKRLAMISDSDSKTAEQAERHQKKLNQMMHQQRSLHGVQVNLFPAPPGHDLNDWHLKQLLHHALQTGQ